MFVNIFINITLSKDPHNTFQLELRVLLRLPYVFAPFLLLFSNLKSTDYFAVDA